MNDGLWRLHRCGTLLGECSSSSWSRCGSLWFLWWENYLARRFRCQSGHRYQGRPPQNRYQSIEPNYQVDICSHSHPLPPVHCWTHSGWLEFPFRKEDRRLVDFYWMHSTWLQASRTSLGHNLVMRNCFLTSGMSCRSDGTLLGC